MKNTFWTNIVASILLVYTSTCSAQIREDYLPGNITLKSGEVLKGFIKNAITSEMNYKISFKNNLSQKKSASYDTNSIKAATIDNGEIYKLIKFATVNGMDSISSLAKLMVSGKASLYEANYRDNKYYLITNNGITYSLQDNKIETGDDRSEVNNHFKEYMKLAFADSDTAIVKSDQAVFNYKSIMNTVTTYNTSLGAANEIRTSKDVKVNYAFASAGGMYKNGSENEFYAQVFIRSYFPKISKGTSVNIGFNYYSIYSLKNLKPNDSRLHTTRTLITLPFQIQQNLADGHFRPYLYGGLNLSYSKLEPKYNTTNKFGLGFLLGGGIEVDVYRGIFIKTEYRFENIQHLILTGLGYYLRIK